MDRVMQKFKRDLLSWGARIKRAGYFLELTCEDTPDGFVLTGHWNDGKYSKEFNPSYVLGSSSVGSNCRRRPRYTVCRFRDDFVRSSMQARGI